MQQKKMSWIELLFAKLKDFADKRNINFQKLRKVAIGFLLFLFAIKIRQFIIKQLRKHQKLPPFMPGIPYFGSLFTMAYHGNDAAMKLFPKFGPICSFNIGNQEFMYINNANLIKHILTNRYCRNRPKFIRNLYISANVEPILMVANDNDKWYLRRQLINKALICKFSNMNSIDLQCKYLLNTYIFDEIDTHYCNL